jgi:hypothetical protein
VLELGTSNLCKIVFVGFHPFSKKAQPGPVLRLAQQRGSIDWAFVLWSPEDENRTDFSRLWVF